MPQAAMARQTICRTLVTMKVWSKMRRTKAVRTAVHREFTVVVCVHGNVTISTLLRFWLVSGGAGEVLPLVTQICEMGVARCSKENDEMEMQESGTESLQR